MHEAGEPDVVGDLFDADGLAGEDLAQIDFLPIEAEAPAAGKGDRLVVEGVVDWWPVAGVLIAVDAASRRLLSEVPLSLSSTGVSGDSTSPSTIRDRRRDRYRQNTPLGVVRTEAGAHTLTIDRKRNKLNAFLPRNTSWKYRTTALLEVKPDNRVARIKGHPLFLDHAKDAILKFVSEPPQA